MQSVIWEWTHVLLLNTPCSHLRSAFAIDMSIGLAAKMNFTHTSREMLGESVTQVLMKCLYRSSRSFLGCVLKRWSTGIDILQNEMQSYLTVRVCAVYWYFVSFTQLNENYSITREFWSAIQKRKERQILS